MTFVKARLALERIGCGHRLVIRLNSGEPLENLPRALAELGHRVSVPEPEAGGGIYLLTVEKV